MPTYVLPDTEERIVAGLLKRRPVAVGAHGDIWTGLGLVVARGGSTRLYAEAAQSLSLVRAAVGTAPTGQDILVDVKLNLTTSILASPVVITAGTNTGTATPVVTSMVAGDFLTVDVLQVGTTEPGRDITVVVYL